MNLIYGQIVEVMDKDGMRFGKLRVGGALKTVTLELVPNADKGDEVLLCDGVAIAQVTAEPAEKPCA